MWYMLNVHQSQESSISMHSKRHESMLKKIVSTLKDYDTSVLQNPGKANVVVDELSRVSIGSLTHVGDDKKS